MGNTESKHFQKVKYNPYREQANVVTVYSYSIASYNKIVFNERIINEKTL